MPHNRPVPPSADPAKLGRALVPAVVVRGTRGAVASPHALATQAGIWTLRARGTAVDAAIATNAALAVVTSYMCGLGGDAFWLIWTPTGGLEALNGSGRSAGGATLQAARTAGFTAMPVRGPWTVTVPGAVRSWGDAHERHGRLPWHELFGPAIELADGFPASPAWCAAVERAARIFGADSDWARVFRPRRRPWQTGEVVRLPTLAGTLRRLALEGPGDAYEGDLGRRAADYLESAGSLLRADDLARHASTWGLPLRATYRGVETTSHPPNSSGAVALQLLQVLQQLDPPSPAAFGPQGVTDVRWVHLVVEAARLAIRDRDTYLTDPDAIPAGTLIEVLGRGHAAVLAARIDPARALALAPSTTPRGGGTVYLATADASGMAVSLIQSNYAGFGSGLVDPQTGIAYHNRGAFFSLDPAHANVLAPRKRTMHTLTPGMLFRDGRPWIVHGSMGGEIQPQVFAQFVSSVVDGGRPIEDAVAAPRFAADADTHGAPRELTRLERGMLPAVGDALAVMGHAVAWVPPLSSELGHEHAVEILYRPHTDVPVSFAATADPRSEGLPGAW
ncbi:MAG: gamma-glutamyltransferase family protein [Candidatus Limnocylindrales bacterium]